MNRILLLLVLCLLSMAVSAQVRNDTIDEVTVTSGRLSHDIVSAIPFRTVTKEEMQQFGLSELSDAVKRLAGANVKDYGGIGGLKTVSVRNLGAHHTAVSYDGITISNTMAGQIDIGRYSLDNIEQVSLAIGQGNDLMQSARHYAAAGVVSITTERPYLTSKPYQLKAHIRGGSFGLISPSLRYWQKIGRNTVLSTDGTFMRADGTYPFTLVNGRMKTRERRNNSDIHSWKGETNLYHTFRDSSELTAKTYYYYSERGLPGVVVLYNNTNNERLWDENFFAQATYKKKVSRQWQIQARLKFDHGWNKYEDVNVKYPGGRQTDIDRQDEYYASATVGWTPYGHLSFALSEDIAYNKMRNNIETQPNPERYTSLTSFSARWQSHRLQVNGNVLTTWMTEHVNLGDKPENRKRLSPTLSASYRLLTDESLFIRVMVKNTFRVPTFTDMYYLHIGNTGLVPEKATEYDAGITWSHYIYKKVGVQLTIDGYFNHIHDKIVCFPTTYVWRMTNFGKVHITGIDATLALSIPLTKDISTEMSASYTLQRAIDKTSPDHASYNSQLPYTPRHSGNGSMLVKTPWFNLGYSMLVCGERWSMAQNTNEYRLKPYCEHSLTASRELKLHNWQLMLSASILNLTNEQYEIIKYYPMPGRTWQASLSACF